MKELKEAHKLFGKHTWELLYHGTLGRVSKCRCGCVRIQHNFENVKDAYEHFEKMVGMLYRVPSKDIIFETDETFLRKEEL